MHPDSDPAAASDVVTPSHSDKVARSAAMLTVRRVVPAALGAISMAVVARYLTLSEFGVLSAGMATYYLLQGACDFGFGTILARELTVSPLQSRAMLRKMLGLALRWSLCVALLMLFLAFGAGIRTSLGAVMLSLVLPLAFAGLSTSRQVFIVAYRVGLMTRVDIASSAVQSVGLAALAIMSTPVWILSLWVAGTAAIANGLVSLMATKHVHGPARCKALPSTRKIIGMVWPVGVISLLASAYLSIDLTVDSLLLPANDLAPYAAALKVLNILISLPTLILAAAVPAMSSLAADRMAMSELMARVLHWMSVTLLPLTVAIFAYSATIISILFGQGYESAAGLLRIVLVAFIVMLVAASLGNFLIIRGRARNMLPTYVGALALNLAGNVALVPHFGVASSAWLTLFAEVFVCGGAVLLLRGEVSLVPAARRVLGSAVATAPILASAWLPISPYLAAAGGILAFLALTSVLHAWPSEFPLVGRFSQNALDPVVATVVR